nr:M23 family metallopeptidase [Alphaproteobacteria bacterium]
GEEMIRYMAFEVKSGAIITSPCKGLVVFAGKFLNYGNMVIISNGEYRVFLYNIEQLFSSTGDIVETGDYIGRAAFSNGEKVLLKLELRKSGESLDPRHWILESEEKKRN